MYSPQISGCNISVGNILSFGTRLVSQELGRLPSIAILWNSFNLITISCSLKF